jgi:RNA polymerase sigma-70 factor, ECF subfamily
MWEGLPSYRHEGPFEGWCYRIVRNAALDLYRERKRLRLFAAPFENVPDPETPSSRTDLAIAFSQMASALTPRQREAVELTLIEGFTAEEAARRMGVAASTVRNLVMQATGRMRDFQK